MLYIFAWKLPSWLMFLEWGQILGILSYGLVVCLLDSVVVALFLAAVTALLPASWLRNDFVVRSAWVLMVWFVAWVIYFFRMASLGFEEGIVVANYIYPWLFSTLTLAALAGLILPRVRLLRDFATWFADRTLIFLWIFVPASLVATIVLFVRNS